MGTTLARAGTWAIALIVGLVFGAAGTIGQAATWGWFPVGLIVALVGAAALIAAIRLLTADRWAALAAGFGIMLTALVLSGRGPGGSVVVPAPADGELSTGIVWTLAVPVVTAIVVVWPSATAVRAAAPESEGRTTN